MLSLLTGESTVTGTHRAVLNGPVGPLGRDIDADVQRSCTLISKIRCQTIIRMLVIEADEHHGADGRHCSRRASLGQTVVVGAE